MENNDADVAELVDARDLKFPAVPDPAQAFVKTASEEPSTAAANPADLQNIKSLATELRSKRHAMPRAQQPHVKNLIEQIDNYVKGDAAQRELLKPHMARSIRSVGL